ncbi:MAG: ParB N-terminal domain-containing protein [Planctomycetes bacterium]|nr:ParB N-terminal domain-containing protein [Planctomycetota bacterium]
MEEKIRETIKEFNRLLGNKNYTLDIINPREIKLLKKNARYMSQEMFENLVNNIKADGALTSLPLCYKDDDDKYVVLSGNHRVQAAVEAKLEQILVIAINKKLSRQESVAIQLSHNAIEGKDDHVILKELWDEVEEIDLKLYAGLDTEILKELEKMEFVTISDTRPDFKQMILTFLPEEIDQLKELIKDADMFFSRDENFILSRKHYEEVFSVMLEVKDRYNIVNSPTAMMKIFELAKLQMDAMRPVDAQP